MAILKTIGETMKIIWIDGTFGSGKTAVANVVAKKMRNSYLLEFDALQMKYKPTSIFDLFGERYPESKKYLIDGLIKEMLKIIQEGSYDYLIIPIALINDDCNERLVNSFANIENYHFILTVANEILYQRIHTQENRDVDLAETYMSNAIMYLNNHYSDALRIDTSDMNIDNVAEEIVKVIVG